MSRRSLGGWGAASVAVLISCASPPDGPASPFAGDDGTPMTGPGGPSGEGGASDDAPGEPSDSANPGTSGSGSGSGGGSGGSGAGPEAGSRVDSGSGSGSSSGAHDSGIDSGSSSGSGSGSGSGGNPPGCTWSVALGYSGSASFTCYYFGQGPMNGGGYKTACGYSGTETTGGSGSNCGQSASDTVQNIANTGLAKSTYFAAIPGDSNGGFSNVVHCGECAKLTNPSNGNAVIVTIIDECPINGSQNSPCKSAGHLDLSMQAFNALGFSTGNPSNTTWKSVPCPVSGTIQAVLNAGVSSQVYFQNTVFPVKAVSNATQSQYGYWQFNSGGAGGQATLTDVEGHTVTATIPGGGGDTKVQFPSPGACP